MSKIFFLIIFQLSFIYSSLLAQINTFERSYPDLEMLPYAGLNTIELPNHESLLLSSSFYPRHVNGTTFYTWKNIILSKLDENGYTIWQKDIETLPTKYRKTNQILLTNQNEIILIIVQQKDSLNNLNILKYDLDGNLTYTATLASENSIVGCAIIKADDDNYLAAYIGDATQVPINILKIDFQLNKIWHKKIYTTASLSSIEFFIRKWGQHNFGIGYQNRILKINSNGDSISIVNRVHNFTSELNDGSLLISGTKTLTKIDSNNNVVWTRNFARDPGPAIQTSDGNYVLFVKNSNYPIDSLIKIDESGNIIWKKICQADVFSISENTDMSLLFSGILYNYYIQSYHYLNRPNIWLLKTNPDGNSIAINLVTPIGYENFLTFNTYTFGWYGNDVQNINLYYSINDGKSWNLITYNLPADIGKYDWTVPLLFADSIKLKIEDSNNPNVFNYTEFPIYISINQPTDKISTNEIFMWIGNNGMGSHDPRTDGSGFYWPGGDSATIPAIFADGLVWGGKVNGEIRVNGSTYRYGLQPGKILENGKADNPLATQSKIFKIRKDWQTLPESVLKQRLQYDYNHWPVDGGAPWDDVNEDGVYTEGFDKPKFIGDETLFYVANDLDTVTSQYTYGSDPMELEFQTTVFGFNREDLKDVVFKKYKVINKSETDITDMYFTYWADDDMGDASDDLAGFDTTYNMGYVFNMDDNDYYYGTPPPTVAHMVVQGPIIPTSDLDSARYNNGWIFGFHNMGMTATGMIMKTSTRWPNDPDLGDYAGTIQFYNMMLGLQQDGSSIINPITGQPTTYPLTGDPVTGVGWYMGDGWPGGPTGGDRRYHIPSGPFNLAVGDTQEVVYAILMAKGTDNLNSITKLRELAAHVQEFYNTELVDILNTKQTIAPAGFTLSQNYPNPFNPKTTIEYEVPEKSFVTIKIYDILGREVQTLVDNQEQVRFKYKVVFDASTLASGVYFYRMQAGSFTETKKMVLIK